MISKSNSISFFDFWIWDVSVSEVGRWDVTDRAEISEVAAQKMSVSISSNSWSLSELDAKNVNIMWNFKPIAAHRFHQKYISEWSESHDLVTHDRVHPWRGVHFRWKNHHFWVLIQGGGGLHDHFFINIKICHFDCHPYYDFNLTNGLDGHNFANLQWSLETIIMNIEHHFQSASNLWEEQRAWLQGLNTELVSLDDFFHHDDL